MAQLSQNSPQSIAGRQKGKEDEALLALPSPQGEGDPGSGRKGSLRASPTVRYSLSLRLPLTALPMTSASQKDPTSRPTTGSPDVLSCPQLDQEWALGKPLTSQNATISDG